MMIFQKKIYFLLLLIYTFFIFGCENREIISTTKVKKEKHKVAILVISDLYVSLSADGLKNGMQDLGYRDGENIEYTIYNAQGDRAKLKTLVEKAIESQPDVLCPSIVTVIDAVKETGTKIPVVFLESMYPVEFGIVKSLVSPGNNYTGVSNMTGPMSGKRLELLTKVDPKIKRVAVICNPENKVSKLALETTQAAAITLGVKLDSYLVYDTKELEAAIDKIRSSPIDAFILNPDFLVFSRLNEIISLAKEKKIPTIGIDSAQVKKGILMSYGGELNEIAKQAATHVDRILKGESPSVIPIEAPRKYHLYVNMTTIENIGLALPQEILYQAEGYYR